MEADWMASPFRITEGEEAGGGLMTRAPPVFLSASDDACIMPPAWAWASRPLGGFWARMLTLAWSV